MDNQASPAKRKSQGVQSIVDLPETVEPSKLRLLTTSPKGKGDRVSDTTDKDLVVRRDVLKKSLERFPFSLKKCLRLGILCGMALSKFPKQAFAVRIEGCPDVDYYLNFTNSDSSVDVLVNRLQAQFDLVFPVLMKQ